MNKPDTDIFTSGSYIPISINAAIASANKSGSVIFDNKLIPLEYTSENLFKEISKEYPLYYTQNNIQYIVYEKIFISDLKKITSNKSTDNNLILCPECHNILPNTGTKVNKNNIVGKSLSVELNNHIKIDFIPKDNIYDKYIILCNHCLSILKNLTIFVIEDDRDYHSPNRIFTI